MWNDQKNVYKCPNIIVEDTDNLKCLFYKTFFGNYLLINTFSIQLVSGFDGNCFSSWCKEYYAVNTTIKCTCSYYDLIWSILLRCLLTFVFLWILVDGGMLLSSQFGNPFAALNGGFTDPSKMNGHGALYFIFNLSVQFIITKI